MSSCETSDAEGPMPVNSAAVLRKSQPAGSSPCRGHVLRKAKVSSSSCRGDTCHEGCLPPWERCGWGGGRHRVLTVSRVPTGSPLFKSEKPRTSCWGHTMSPPGLLWSPVPTRDRP